MRKASLYSSRRACCAIDGAGRFQDPQLEQLARVVPLVHRVADVEAFVALQANQIGIERRGDRCGQRGLADAGFALEKQGASEAQGQKQRNSQALVGDVVVVSPRRAASRKVNRKT